MLHQDRNQLSRPRTVDGALVVDGIAARVHPLGDPLQYDSGPEHRDLAALRDIVKQLPGVPVTMPHAGRVVGTVERAWIEDDARAACTMRITDRQAADAITRGTKELSIGYGTDVVATWQTNVQLVELSIVERARCGSTCTITTDHSHATVTPSGATVNSQLLAAAAQRLNIRTDGLDERGLAFAVMRASGQDPEAPRNDEDSTKISAQSLDYVIARAISAAGYHERDQQRRADAVAFATVKPPATVQHVDCRCGGQPTWPHVDSDPEVEARARNESRSRLAYAVPVDEETARADEATAIEALRVRVPRLIARPLPAPVVIVDEAATRAKMHSDSRAAHKAADDQGGN